MDSQNPSSHLRLSEMNTLLKTLNPNKVMFPLAWNSYKGYGIVHRCEGTAVQL